MRLRLTRRRARGRPRLVPSYRAAIGYVAYADRFGGTLAGVGERLDYLAELHVDYLHLMKVLRPREGANDGGYAVVDYGDVDPALGTRADLERLATTCTAAGSACASTSC